MRSRIIPIFLLVIITFLTFYPTLNNKFTNWDDNEYITENGLIRELSFAGVKKIFTTYTGANYHPLVFLSYMIEYYFWRLDPFGYHFVNLILHIINVLLVYMLISKISLPPPFLLKGQIRGSEIVPLITALLFAIHPINVESVAWIAERKNLLSTFFLLLTLITYLSYAYNKNRKKYYISLTLFTLALLSKVSVIIIPVLLMLIDWYKGRYKFLSKEKFSPVILKRKVLLEKFPFFVISASFAIMGFLAQYSDGAVKQFYGGSFLSNFIISCNGIVFYFYKLLYPIDLYARYTLYDSMLLYPVVILFSIIGLLIFIGRYSKIIMFSGLFFFITLFPMSNLLIPLSTIVADRYMYVSAIGFFLLTAVGIVKLYSKIKTVWLKKVYITVSCLLLLALSIITFNQCKIWENSFTLWTDVLKKDPDNVIAYSNMSEVYLRMGKNVEAAQIAIKAINKGFESVAVINNLAIAYVGMGEFEKAIATFQALIDAYPDYAIAYSKIGTICQKQKQFKQAEKYMLQAVQLQENTSNKEAGVYYNIGLLYRELKEFEKSKVFLQRAVDISPYNALYYLYLGDIYYELGDKKEAIKNLKKVIDLNPEYEEALITLKGLEEKK